MFPISLVSPAFVRGDPMGKDQFNREQIGMIEPIKRLGDPTICESSHFLGSPHDSAASQT